MRRRIVYLAIKAIFFLWLLGGAVWFTYGVYQFRKSIQSQPDPGLKSGAIVLPLKVIDGDEILVRHNGHRFIVRLAAIKAFDPNTNDRIFDAFGKEAVRFLQSKIDSARKTEFKVTFEKKIIDSKNRLIATMLGPLPSKKDLAKELLSQGFAVVYTKFEHPLLARYRKVQNKAKKKRKGIWKNKRLRERVEKMIKAWERESQ